MDVLYSGDGYRGGEDISFCYITPPSDSYVIDEITTREDVRRFVYSDEREVLGFLSYDYGLVLKGIPSEKERDIEYGLLKKNIWYMPDTKTIR